ncbi:MAG: NAD(P)/FAD-dependent oxidoreductase [Candidatus Fimadaptatus sp.]|nr:NAD(P)/FAD-dependent oxidoreductase [Candidatus Fimadaptatus sp.]
MRKDQYDVLIIGAGVTGCAIARELSHTGLKIALSDACDDVAMGASRANSAIVHAGYDCVPGTLMAKLNVRGNEMFDDVCESLNVPLLRVGSFVIAFGEEDEKELNNLLERGRANGVPGLEIISGERAREMEPKLSDDVTAALWAPTAGITCPYELTIAMSENARANGADILLRKRAVAIDYANDEFTVKFEDGTSVSAKYVVNAAGVYADEVARLIGDDSFTISPRKGEYMLLDKQALCVGTVIFQTPSKLGKGVLVSPTVDGNIFAGPTAQDKVEKNDTQTTPEGLAELKKFSLKSVPTLNLRQVITSFAGVRAQPSTGDFIIRPSDKNARFIHAAGICSPGLSSAPAIAEYVRGLIKEAGADTAERADAIYVREHAKPFRQMDAEERAEAYKRNPLYGRIICRCETVTEAEIVDAIHRGATTVDGVKRRTRAGMGRCQGGFCAPRVMEILSRELGVPTESLTKFGGESYMVAGKLGEVKGHE